VAGDRYLWKHVNLTPFNLPLRQLKTFTKNYLSDTLQSLQLKGYETAGMFIKHTVCRFTNAVYFLC